MALAYRIAFFSIIGIIVYVYAGYPLVLLVLGLFKKRHKYSDSGHLPSVALIISVNNEEKIIREKIENSLELEYPEDKLRIIVASDGSVDGTNDIVKQYIERNVILKEFDCREGKSSTLNRAVLGLDDEVLIFSDANAFYKKDAIKKLVENFTDPEVGCVVGSLVYIKNHSYVGRGESIYWRYESLLNIFESRLKSVLVATGTIFAIRRELFRPVMKDVANDFQLPAEVASQGYGVVYEKDAIAYERSTCLCSEEFGRKRRIIIRGLTGYKHLRHDFGGMFRLYQFVSRKLLRWWIGPMLPCLYLSNLLLAGEPFFYGVFLLQNVFYAFAAVGLLLRRGKVQSKIFLVPFYFVMVNAAALTAIITYIRGIRLSSWEKAETTRDIEGHPMVTPKLQVIEGKKEVAYHREKSSANLEKIK